MQLGLAGVDVKTEEPDWFGVSYRLPIDPEASLAERQAQWLAYVEPQIEKLKREGAFARNVNKRHEE
jgi:predicted cobalt transporter CbtA